jgi:hypothetical protein
MSINRINGFYVGKWSYKETIDMTLDERNAEVNQALEARFSQLNAALEAHEAQLKAMMVPKDAFVMYESCEEKDECGESIGQHQSFLGMIKLRGAWRLCHSTSFQSYSGFEENSGWMPLVDTNIETRICAADHIDKLREAIVETKEKLIPDVERAISTLAKSL